MKLDIVLRGQDLERPKVHSSYSTQVWLILKGTPDSAAVRECSECVAVTCTTQPTRQRRVYSTWTGASSAAEASSAADIATVLHAMALGGTDRHTTRMRW